MASDHLERLWKSIIPLSSLPKTRQDTVLNASRFQTAPLGPIDGVATTRRMQHELTQNRIEKLTERVDKIIEAVDQAKASLVQTDGKINGLMDKTLESTTALVNRTQARVLEAVGRPVQEDTMKDLLESQKDILGIVNSILQHTTSLQANQANLQASLIALMSQVQHVSTQVTSVEQRLAARLDGLEGKPLAMDRRRKRALEATSPNAEIDTRPSKRRKIEGREWNPRNTDSTFSIGFVTASASAPLSPSSQTSSEESAGSPLTPLETQGHQQDQGFVEKLHNGLDQAPRVGTMSTGGRTSARLTKAQKLASYLGDDYEEGSMEDLFSRLA